MADFAGVDFLRLDDLLSDEERITRDTVREFVSREFLPLIQEHIRKDGSFPMELVPRMGELGLFGTNLQGYGCAGMNATEYGLINQELERGDSGVRSFNSVQSALVMFPIHAYGSEEQKQKWLPKMATGEALGCFGLTEPDFGSNPGGMRATARLEGDEWVLNGEKTWITSGSVADVAVVWARTRDGVRGFLVESGTDGFSSVDHRGKYSLRASVTSQLAFQDCRVPAESLMPGTTGLKDALMCLNQARYGIAWGALGSAMATFSDTVAFLSRLANWPNFLRRCRRRLSSLRRSLAGTF